MPHDDDRHDDGALPPELAAVDAMLERLAEAERAGGGAGLEDRLMAATRCARRGGGTATGSAEAARDVIHMVEGVEALAAHEREAAGVAFEQRVFMATRAFVGRRQSESTADVVVRPAGRRLALMGVLRLAAVIAVVGAGIGAWVNLRPAPVPVVENTDQGSVHLAMQIDERLETFLAADWSPLTSERFEEIDRDMESLSMQVEGEWFQFGRLAEEEAM